MVFVCATQNVAMNDLSETGAGTARRHHAKRGVPDPGGVGTEEYGQETGEGARGSAAARQ
jgi:hypothetical protein